MWIQPLGSTISNCCRDEEEEEEEEEVDHLSGYEIINNTILSQVGKSRYPDLLQVVEVVSHSDRDLTGCVALIKLEIHIKNN